MRHEQEPLSLVMIDLIRPRKMSSICYTSSTKFSFKQLTYGSEEEEEEE